MYILSRVNSGKLKIMQIKERILKVSLKIFHVQKRRNVCCATYDV